jgi:hypothetical protein
MKTRPRARLKKRLHYVQALFYCLEKLQPGSLEKITAWQPGKITAWKNYSLAAWQPGSRK